MSESKIENPKSKIPSTPRLPLIEQREIEARIVGPLVRAFITEIGEQRTLEIVRDLIRDLARQGGSDLAKVLGDHTLEAFARGLDRWRENGALEIDMLEQSPTRLSFNVTRCRYAEMYKALGLPDLGGSLSCERDFALVQGFNSDIELTRTQTIMEGAAWCDFRFRLREPAKPEDGA
jgi:L-2-amino-thiazoline-4-carboxylic acid hydrolase